MPGRTISFDDHFESQAVFLYGSVEAADRELMTLVSTLASAERIPSRGEIFVEHADSIVQVLYRVSATGQVVTVLGIALLKRAA